MPNLMFPPTESSLRALVFEMLANYRDHMSDHEREQFPFFVGVESNGTILVFGGETDPVFEIVVKLG